MKTNSKFTFEIAKPEYANNILKIIESGSFAGNIELIYTKRPNDTIKLTVMRNNKEYTLNMVLGKRT